MNVVSHSVADADDALDIRSTGTAAETPSV